MTHLLSAWTHAWSALQLEPPVGLHAQLLHAYAQPQRHYHTQQHLAECLEWLAPAQHLAQRPGEIGIALWFHDAVYEVRSHDNEARSADWASAALHAAGASPEVQARVHALIMATAHTAAPVAGDAALLVDIDLAILGAHPARFAAYTQQIRQEYAWVPEEVFVAKRHAILQSFQARERIYSTSFFHERLETSARANLTMALQAGVPSSAPH